MKVAYSQLKKVLPGLSLSPADLADLLTHQGLVVEDITPVNQYFAAECLAATLEEQIVQGDLSLCTMKAGSRVFRLSVESWGVPPIGSRVLVNPVGSGLQILPLKGLSPLEQASFLTRLPSEVPENERVELDETGEDVLIECEITANRGDCLSVLGLAREISAGVDLDLLEPDTGFSASENQTDFTLENQNVLNLCPYYTGRVIQNVVVRPSSWSVVRDLLLLGLRPVNNIVDYTNLVMMEFGQPIHAFDASTLRGRSIVVRLSRPGEGIISLDGIERETTADMLMIADQKRPVALAGVMGGKETEVVPSTGEIFLEAAVFDGVSVRRTARALGMRTEASTRFERGVDPKSVIRASSRFLALLENDQRTVEILSPWLQSGEPPVHQREIPFRLEYITDIMAFSVEKEKTRRIVSRLGFQIDESGETPHVLVPSWRTDVREEIDLAEEVGRVAGYRNIESLLPEVPYDPGNQDSGRRIKNTIRTVLIDRGLYEIVTIPFIHQETVSKLGLDEQTLVRVINPLIHEQDVLRSSLFASSIEALRTNIARGRHPLGVFEIGDVFLRKPHAQHRFEEESRVFLALDGSFMPPLWRKGQSDLIYEVKGLFEAIINRLGIDINSFEIKPGADPAGLFDPSAVFSYYRSNQSELVSWAGLLRENVISGCGLWGKIFCLELRLAPLVELNAGKKSARFDISRFPSVRRDVSLFVPVETSWQAIHELVHQIARSDRMDLESIELFDHYQGKSLPVHRKSLSFSMIFRSPSQTLTDTEIDQWVARIKEALKALDGVILREDYSESER